MRPAVRTENGADIDSNYKCADEDDGCPTTRWAVCALDSAASMDDTIAFLTCFDQLSLSPPYGSGAANWTSQCSTVAGLNLEDIKACQGGSRGDEILHESAAYFESIFPSHAHSGAFMVPHVYINDDEKFPKDKDRSLGHMTELLCSVGAQAAVCRNTSSFVV